VRAGVKVNRAFPCPQIRGLVKSDDRDVILITIRFFDRIMLTAHPHRRLLNAERQSNIREAVSIESRVLYPAHCRNSRNSIASRADALAPVGRAVTLKSDGLVE
jgi:hypothetical protein